MLLSEVIAQLQVGEFRQVSFGTGAGIITPADYNNIMLHINLGLANLYKRFNIKTGSVILQLNPDISKYQVTSHNSIRKEGFSRKYVIDTDEPFKDDINKIEKITDEFGLAVPLNETGNPLSVFNTTLTTLEFPRKILEDIRNRPEDAKMDKVTLTYRAGYFPSVKLGEVAIPLVTEIPLPPMYLEALLYFIASRVHNPVGMNQEFHEGNNYASKYELECQRIENLGLQVNTTNIVDNIQRHGWV